MARRRAKDKDAVDKRGKKGKKTRCIKKLLIFEGILLLLLIPTLFFVYSLSKIDHYDLNLGDVAMNDVKNPDKESYRTLVLFGVDSRKGELEQNTRTDSIIVASIHKRTKKVRLLSLFRDTRVHVEGHGFTKLNHAYAYGGPELALSTINRNFDLTITDFATVNFSALTNVIDALGGVTLNIKKKELKHVNAYTRDVAKINGTTFEYLKKPGKQVVTGTQATAYTRVRYTAGGDFTRAERQRTVIQAIMKKAKSTNPIKLAGVMQTVLPQIKTSLSSLEVLGLATSVLFYQIEEQDGFPFDQTSQSIGGLSMVVPRTLPSNVVKMHQFLYGTEGYKPSTAVENIGKGKP